MAITIRGSADKIVDQIAATLSRYDRANARAEIVLYRLSPVSVRIRIVDPGFRGLDKSARHAKAWSYLQDLPEDVLGDISMLVLLTPNEKKKSFSNLEFDDPIPSAL